MEHDNLSVLYEENGRVAAVFWEWRNKLLTYYFTAIGGVFVLSGWLYSNKLGKIAAVPLLLPPILSVVAILVDSRNADILKASYIAGENLERMLLAGSRATEEVGIYSVIGKRHQKRFGKFLTYTWTLPIIYSVVGAFILAFFMIACLKL
jgi:hypothetical protein